MFEISLTDFYTHTHIDMCMLFSISVFIIHEQMRNIDSQFPLLIMFTYANEHMWFIQRYIRPDDLITCSNSATPK